MSADQRVQRFEAVFPECRGQIHALNYLDAGGAAESSGNCPVTYGFGCPSRHGVIRILRSTSVAFSPSRTISFRTDEPIKSVSNTARRGGRISNERFHGPFFSDAEEPLKVISVSVSIPH